MRRFAPYRRITSSRRSAHVRVRRFAASRAATNAEIRATFSLTARRPSARAPTPTIAPPRRRLAHCPPSGPASAHADDRAAAPPTALPAAASTDRTRVAAPTRHRTTHFATTLHQLRADPRASGRPGALRRRRSPRARHLAPDRSSPSRPRPFPSWPRSWCRSAVPSAALAERWLRPVPGEVARTFDYSRAAPFARGAHRGADLAAPPGTPVRSACGGRVVHAGAVAGRRRRERPLRRACRVSYLPLASLAVRAGADLRAGAPIGTVAAGHGGLHLGVRREGDPFGYEDPLPLLARAPARPRRPPATPPARPDRARARAPAAGPARARTALARRCRGSPRMRVRAAIAPPGRPAARCRVAPWPRRGPGSALAARAARRDPGTVAGGAGARQSRTRTRVGPRARRPRARAAPPHR